MTPDKPAELSLIEKRAVDVEAEERIRRTFVMAEDGLLARPGLDDMAR